MKDIKISDSIFYIGADDKDIRLFEGQFNVPNGMAYNSYLIKDDKNVVMDTCDKKVTNTWLENLEKALDGEKVDYLVVSHMEPDHAYNIGLLVDKYPDMKIVGNATTFSMLLNFFDIDLENKKIEVKEGQQLNIGKHTLQFFMAPMIHWPEVMVTYDVLDKVLFTADGFGKFGTLDTDEDWDCEARRYYFGIVGKYGVQVQALLKKVATLDVNIICPLHGPILRENLAHYIEKYNTWSSYKPEDDGIFIACASIYGNTLKAAEKLKEILEEKGAKKVSLIDLTKEDMHEAVEDAFRYNKIVLAASSYNAGVFVPMEQFLNHLKSRNYQNRKVAIIQNGSWAPSAEKTIRNMLQGMNNIDIIENAITIKSTLKDDNITELEQLADKLLGGE